MTTGVRRLLPAVALVGLAALSAACGTTVDLSQRQQVPGAAAGASSNGLAGPANAPAQAALVGGPAAPGAAVTGPGGGAATTTGNAAVAAPGTGPGTAQLPPATGARTDAKGIPQGPGVTATTITIGVSYTSNGDAANAALGASGITQGDQVGEAKAVIAAINARGGVAGRKLVAVFHAYDAQSSQTNAQQDQGACADFTQDHQVFAVAAAGLTETFSACMAKAGVMQVYSGDIINNDLAYFQKYPAYVDAGTLTQDRMMRDLAARLNTRGYFGGWDANTGTAVSGKPAKIGILSINDPNWERPLTKVLLPALAKAGHPVDAADVYRVNPGQSSADTGATVADIQSSALRFRNDGVTHVIFLDATGALTLFFAQNAKNQRYYPRFGVNSGSGLQALVDAGVLDPTQLKGALGIGWMPNLDLKAAYAKKWPGPGTADCLEIMRKGGYSFPDANSASIALSECDELKLIAAAINSAGSSITLPNVLGALNALGSRFPAAALPQAFFSPSRHDAAQKIFDLGWDTQCSCATYLDNGHSAP